jgi:hypothetical protein
LAFPSCNQPMVVVTVLVFFEAGPFSTRDKPYGGVRFLPTPR